MIQCPQCQIWQYAHVSYVVEVCCVGCGRQLIAPRPVPFATTHGPPARGHRERLRVIEAHRAGLTALR